mmetsp:Transcript_68030/g.134851  ORF Transcript_68030/g.134851 Transcript_68030/m.134851 type:complete len:342 (-) Transcript_68030:15-1040(-)
MANHAVLKKLALLRDKLELRRDDIAVSQAALEDESRELKGRQEQLNIVRAQINKSVEEMEDHGRKSREHTAAQDEFKHEELAMRHAFRTILDQGLKQLKAAHKERIEKLKEAADSESDGREVSVLFGDEEGVFRIVDEAYTFDFLIADASRYFEQNPLDMQLVNEKDELWSGDASVRKEMAAFDNQYGRILMKRKPLELVEDEDEIGESEDAMLLLLGQEEEIEEDEDDQADLIGGAVPVRKKTFDRKSLWRELPFFLAFMNLFIFSLYSRRSTSEGYFQVNAIRTGLVEENFGDYNEKAFEDIRNFEEVFEWIENVFVEGIYPDAKYNEQPFLPREVHST